MPIIVAIILLTAVYAIAISSARRRLRAAIAKAVERGLPVTPEEHSGEPAADSDNSTPIYRAISEALSTRRAEADFDSLLGSFLDQQSRALCPGIWDEARELVDGLAEVFGMIEEASRRPSYWIGRDAKTGEIMGEDDYLCTQAQRDAVRLLGVRGTVRAYQGDTDGALADIAACFRIGEHPAQRRSLLAFLIRTALMNISIIGSMSVLSANRPTSQHIDALDALLRSIGLDADFGRCVAGEVAFSATLPPGELWRLWPAGALNATAKAVEMAIRTMDELHLDYEDALRERIVAPPYASRTLSAVSIYPTANFQRYLNIANIACARAALRVMDSYLHDGMWPESLQGLDVPLSPFTGDRPRYEPRPDGFRVCIDDSGHGRSVAVQAREGADGSFVCSYTVSYASVGDTAR